MKYRMLENWGEKGTKGPKKGEVIDLTGAEEIYDDHGFLDYWFFKYEGEFFELYPYEVEKL